MNIEEKNTAWLSAGGNRLNTAEEAGQGSTNRGSRSVAEAASASVTRHLDWRRGNNGSGGEDNPSERAFSESNASTGTAAGPMTTMNDPDEFDLEMHADGDTLFVSGDIDLHQAARFAERAEQHIRQIEQPRLDLTGVLFLDSAGLATLLSLSKLARAQDKPLRLIATGSPRRVLRITGIDRVLAVED